MIRKLTCVTAAIAVLLLSASFASAQSYWYIDSTQSYAQLSFGSTVIPASDSPFGIQLTIDLDNQAGSPHAWNDGNVGPLAGTFATTGIFDGTSVNFSAAGNAIVGIDHTTGNPGDPPGTHTLGFTPNPALWDPNADNGDGGTGEYTGTFPPAPAMWANNAYVEELGLMVTNNAFQDTHFGIDSLAPAPVSAGTFDTSNSPFGLVQTDFLLKSQQPSLVTSGDVQDVNPMVANPNAVTYYPNQAVAALGPAGEGQIIPLGGDAYEMVMPFVIPFVFFVGSVPFGIDTDPNSPNYGNVTGYMTGVIVATHVPEPSTFLMGGFGLVSLGLVARRKFRKARA